MVEWKNLALIIEAEPMHRDLMKLALQNLNCEVVTAGDAPTARRLLMQRKPDLLVIDTFLPKANGFDLLRSYQNDGLLENTRVIVVSAMAFEEIVRQVSQLGVSAYLVKPVDLQMLSARAKALLDSNPRRVGRQP
jgi:DNA-binding response OmpR family regulator